MPINSNLFKLAVSPKAIASGNNLPLRPFSIMVAAADGTNGIGKGSKIPWHVPEDLKLLEETTKFTGTGPAAASKINAVIMGRKTYESIPAKFRPMAGRITLILTTNETWQPEEVSQEGKEFIVVRNGGLKAALELLAKPPLVERVFRVWNLGGTDFYKQATEEPCRSVLQSIYLTRINKDIVKDPETPFTAFFPDLKNFGLTFEEEAAPEVLSEGKAVLHRYVPRNDEEYQYVNLIRTIMATGSVKEDRTGVGTIGVFGAQMRFSLRGGRWPLLTTKRVFWKGVCEELLWFLRGDTDSKLLEAKNVNIWKGNGSREFLDSRGLKDNAPGDLGPVYGFQWRHFGSDYTDCNENYDGKGIDQVKRIVETLKTNPNDRRLLLSAWNPCAIDKMALPPCHVLAQFNADVARNELSCQLYQRSCDMGLGVPFNIASYALLTLLICRATGFQPGDFIHTLGDAHVYRNHVEPLKEQLQRVPRHFPYLRIVKDRDFLEDYELGDFEILDYNPYPTIQMEMAV